MIAPPATQEPPDMLRTEIVRGLTTATGETSGGSCVAVPSTLDLRPSTDLSAFSADKLAWSRLTDAQRSRVTTKEAIFRAVAGEIARTGNKGTAMALCKAHAQRLQLRGFSAVRLYNDYYAWLRAGRHWSALVKTGTVERGVALVTVEHVHGWMLKNKRSSEQGYRDFLDAWRAGAFVPGIGTWPQWFAKRWPDRPLPRTCPPDLPYGWSYENFIGKLSRAAAAAARQGLAAALNELPSIPGSRTGMLPLRFVTFDDCKTDMRSHADDIERPVDVVALVSLDISCAFGLGFSLRPTLLREDGTGEKLQARDTKAHLVELLSTWGWPDYGMTIIQERGTAHADLAFQRALAEATGGKVTFRDASMLKGTVWEGGFADRAVGNSRAKSWIESWFNSFHNVNASQPGQTGRRYDVSPQDDHGRRQELKMLVKAGRKLTPEQRADLRLPFLSLQEMRPVIATALHKLNSRRDHALQDFEERLVWRFREGEDWQPEAALLDLDEAQLAAIRTDRQLETPAERLARLIKEQQALGVRFHRLAPESAARLLEEVREIEIEKGEVRFKFDGKKCRYTPFTPQNRETLAALRHGKKYLAYYDSSQDQLPARLYVTDGAGRWIGTLDRTHGIGQGDQYREQVADANATKRSLLKEACATVNRSAPDVAEQREEDVQHNLDVLALGTAMHLPAFVPGADAIAAPAAHATAHADATAIKTDAAKRRKINPTKAAEDLTRLQQAKAAAEPASDEGSWA